MVSRGSKVELLDGSGLVLTDPQGTRVWSSISVSNLAYGFMNDTGNFVLVVGFYQYMESFDSLRILSWPTQGYYISNTYDASNSTNSGDQLIFDATGLLHILKRNGERSELTPKDALPSGDYYHRATLGFDGVFTQYYYPKNSDGNTSWSISLLEPANICQDIISDKGSGACGFNNVCRVVIDRSARVILMKQEQSENIDNHRIIPLRFKDELGKGSFGIIYKGVIRTNTVAVKKLNRLAEDGEKEFRTEQRLLVYEYMSNGTLSSFLFGDERPSWEQRSHIALGIAKGLSYLHDECSTQIIHCDIKPQNVLLEDFYSAKISDFGLAKLLLTNQSRTSTGIRGTKGYVAPEWFRNTPVTMMVDVYSYGVLLLEIVSCRKSVKEFGTGDEYGEIFTDLAWDCYQEGRLEVFVENDLEALDDYKKLRIFVMVGLWSYFKTIPFLRPTKVEGHTMHRWVM
ncbi:G-type lectin S-receptor-like serine/threonine-protein kinase LECRK3 [Tanacetum coccineum]